MLIYLYGADAYRRNLKANEIVSRFSKKNAPVVNEVFAFGKDLTTEQLKSEVGRLVTFLGSQSLFGGGVLAQVAELEESTKDLLAALKREAANEDVARLVVVSVLKKLPKEFSFLEKLPARVFDFAPFEDLKEFSAFLRGEVKNRDLAVAPNLIDQIAKVFIGDSWSAITELERLSLGGVASFNLPVPDFFSLVQKIKGAATVSAKLSALAIALEKEEPAAVFNMLASLASGETKVLMADYDIAVKSGKLEYDDVLLDFVLGGKLFSEARF